MLYGKRFFLQYQTDSIMALADAASTFQTQASKQTILASPFFLTRTPGYAALWGLSGGNRMWGSIWRWERWILEPGVFFLSVSVSGSARPKWMLTGANGRREPPAQDGLPILYIYIYYMPFQKLWAHLLYYFLLIIRRWLFLSVACFLVSVSSIGQNSHQRKEKHLREEILQNCEADLCRRLFKSSESTTSNPTPCSPLRGQTSSRDSQRWGQPNRSSVRQSRRRNLWRFYFIWSNKNVKRPSVFNFLGGFRSYLNF